VRQNANRINPKVGVTLPELSDDMELARSLKPLIFGLWNHGRMTQAGWRSAMSVENKTIVKVLITQLAREMRALMTTENTMDVPDDLY
jgi:hypothetical protein